MEIVIQKFGGTSLRNRARRKLVIEKIKALLNKNLMPVVVVSAMGRMGDPYATDSLLSLVNKNLRNKNPKAVDFLMSCGEMVSAAVLCSELQEEGITSMPLTGGQAGIITDNSYTNASVINIDTTYLKELLVQGIIPIVTGFQGITEKGEITTLGRGGSDTSASILGVALKAKAIEIYTDVDGIMTADPRIVEDAALISNMNYYEVFEYADQGAKVIHPRAVKSAMAGGIPLLIKNSLKDSEGTLIDGSIPEGKGIISGITHLPNRVQVIVKREHNIANDNYKNLLSLMAGENISIDLINVFPDKKLFTIGEEDVNKLEALFTRKDIQYLVVEDCSKLAVIGAGMRGIPGVMASIVEVLNEEDIDVLQSADSYITIWCLIKSMHVEKAIKALHKKFM